MIDPPLTVLAQPVRRMAKRAIELLLERVERGRTEPTHIVLPLDLRLGESCGMRGPTTRERNR